MQKMTKSLKEKLEILNDFLINDRPDKSEDPVADFKKIKGKLSTKVVAEKLGINEQMLSEVDLCMVNFSKFQNDDDLKRIASLRLASWMHTLSKTTGADVAIELEKITSNEQLAIKQVRATELVLRDFIYDHNGGSSELAKKLGDFFNSSVVQKWLSSADNTGVLSGTTFSELSALFLDKRMFESYDKVFEHDKGLKYDKKKTGSLRYFLDDIRIIRNSIAHNKKISNVQIELLNEYYNEIVGRIEQAHKSGNTKVNPGVYLDVSEEEIRGYMSSVKEDMYEIKEGLGELSRKVDEGFTKVLDDTQEIKDIISSKWVSKKFISLYSIIIILAILSVFIVNKYMSRDVSLKIQFSWINANVSLPFEELKIITLSTTNYTKEFHLSTDGLLEINDIPKDNLNEKIILTFEDNRVVQIDTPLIERDLILPVKLSIKNINQVSLIVRDYETGQPVKDVNISFSELTSSTDNFGRATIAIPEDKLSRFINIELLAEGYQYYKLNNVPVNSKTPIEVLLEKI